MARAQRLQAACLHLPLSRSGFRESGRMEIRRGKTIVVSLAYNFLSLNHHFSLGLLQTTRRQCSNMREGLKHQHNCLHCNISPLLQLLSVMELFQKTRQAALLDRSRLLEQPLPSILSSLFSLLPSSQHCRPPSTSKQSHERMLTWLLGTFCTSKASPSTRLKGGHSSASLRL